MKTTWSLVALLAVAGVSAAVAQTPAAKGGEITFTAKSVNVSDPGRPVRIRIFRWSTDQERTPLLDALNPPPAPPPAAAAADGAGARGGRAGGRGGRGGRGRGAEEPLDPISAFTAALGRAPTIGYIWTDDVTGYSIKYAQRFPTPDGGERMILATDRRLGAHNPAWTPAGGAPVPDYAFTVLDVRMDAKGVGEAKTSLTSKVVIDKEAGTLALENVAAAPAILQVKK
jgi:hypothetical protein